MRVHQTHQVLRQHQLHQPQQQQLLQLQLLQQQQQQQSQQPQHRCQQQLRVELQQQVTSIRNIIVYYEKPNFKMTS